MSNKLPTESKIFTNLKRSVDDRGQIMSIVDNSVPIDLYSTLYKKEKRYSFSSSSYEDQMNLLKNYVLHRFSSKNP